MSTQPVMGDQEREAMVSAFGENRVLSFKDVTTGEQIALVMCPCLMCGAIVNDPLTHWNWHKRVQLT